MPPAPWLRWLTAATLAFDLTTLTWVVIGVLTPGDSFYLGPIDLVALVALPALGLWRGYRASGRPARWAIFVAAVPAVAFWLLVPDAWWANAPPPAPPEAPAASP
jgi:hypothetical protein